MTQESREQRLTNLKKLGTVLNAWHFVYAIIFITFFPYLTIGTAIHEHVVSISRHGTVGILLAPFYVKWITLILRWYAKTGRNLESPTLVPMLLGGALIGTLISYVILRIFKHEGNWESTLAISYYDAIFSVVFNLILAMLAGFWMLTIVYYRVGENIIRRHRESTPFWKVVIALFSIPILLIFATLIFSLMI